MFGTGNFLVPLCLWFGLLFFITAAVRANFFVYACSLLSYYCQYFDYGFRNFDRLLRFIRFLFSHAREGIS